jgi:hypothetical protein
MIRFTCSNCGATFDADETQPQLQCMNCGAIYQKNPQPQYNNLQGNTQNQQYYNGQQVNIQGQPQVNMQNCQNMNLNAPLQQSYNNNQQIPRKKNNTGVIVGAVVGGIAVLIVAAVGITAVFKKISSAKLDAEVSEIVNELPVSAIEPNSESIVQESEIEVVEESSVVSESEYESSTSTTTTSDNIWSYYYHGITFKLNYDWFSNLEVDDDDSLFIIPEEYERNLGIFAYYDQSMEGIAFDSFESDSTCTDYITVISDTLGLSNTQYKYKLGDNAHTFVVLGYDENECYVYVIDLITKDNNEYTFIAYGTPSLDADTVNQAMQDFINNSDMISVLGL